MNQKKKVVVIGAGPAGLTAAYQLTQAGSFDVCVVEAGSEVGGMSKTIPLWNCLVDLGPHRFFSADPEINAFWLGVAQKDFEDVSRLTRIFYNNKFFYYPLKIGNVLWNLGILESIFCIGSYLSVKLWPEKDESHFEGWVINRFGRRLYHFFFKSYSEKLWGISCQNLDADFARQRIRRLSFFEAVKNAIQISSQTTHKSLVDSFRYSTGGTGAFYQKLAQHITQSGGQILFDARVKQLIQNKSEVTGVGLVDGTLIEADHVISTMPLNLLIKGMQDVPKDVQKSSEQLQFRNTILVYLLIDETSLFPDQWLYIHSSNLQTGRITNYRNWSRSLFGKEKTSIVSLEYWCFKEDKIWGASDEDLIKNAQDEFIKCGLCTKEKILKGHVVRIPRCYPIYRTGFRENLKLLQDYLQKISGLAVIGRGGAFKYNNQDHSILMGLMAAKNVQGADLDLWAVNCDYDYQEEERSGVDHDSIRDL